MREGKGDRKGKGGIRETGEEPALPKKSRRPVCYCLYLWSCCTTMVCLCSHCVLNDQGGSFCTVYVKIASDRRITYLEIMS